jgi:protein gp37
MSDITYWKVDWMIKVLNKIKEYPQHQFLFLTKNPVCYFKYEFPKNCWQGVMVTNNNELTTYQDILRFFQNKTFISLEPILEQIDINYFDIESFNWVIIGAETGKRKGKIIPKKEWIENIRIFCQKNNIPYFEKNSLRAIVNRELIQEFPK